MKHALATAMTGLRTRLGSKPPRISRAALWMIVPIYAVFGVLIYLALFGMVVFNATDSLRGHGFLAFKFPKPLIRGSVVVAPPPAIYADKFEGLVFTKRLIGKPGDEIVQVGGSVCIQGQCFEPATRDGQAFGRLLNAGVIPNGFVALFGETPTSLDSRYQKVGLFAIKDIIAVGFSIPGFPHWSALPKRGNGL